MFYRQMCVAYAYSTPFCPGVTKTCHSHFFLEMLLDRKRSPQFWAACHFFTASPKANLFTLWLPAALYSWDNPQKLSLFSPLSFPVSPSETTWRESYLLTWDVKVNLLPGDSRSSLKKDKRTSGHLLSFAPKWLFRVWCCLWFRPQSHSKLSLQ